VEVAHQHSDFSTCDHQNGKDEEKESKDVVDSVEPDRVHDKVEFDKDSAEGQDTPDKGGNPRVEV
jgi:hypothetical protein